MSWRCLRYFVVIVFIVDVIIIIIIVIIIIIIISNEYLSSFENLTDFQMFGMLNS